MTRQVLISPRQDDLQLCDTAGVDFPTSGQLRTVVISATWHDFPMSEQFRAVVICVIRQCQTAKADMQLAEWQGTLHVQNVEENC